MLQILISLAIYMVLVIPMGTYMYHIATNKKTFADPVFNRIDNGIYKLCRINRQGMNWKQYALHLLMANARFEIPGSSFQQPQRNRRNGTNPFF